MSCNDIQNFIHGYIDGELDLVKSLEVEQHMKDCPVCTRAYNNQQALRSAITSASLYSDAPTNLRKRVRSAVRQVSKRESREPRFSWRWFAIGAPLVGAAAVLIISLVPVFTRSSTETLLTQEVISGHVRSLMANLYRCGLNAPGKTLRLVTLPFGLRSTSTMSKRQGTSRWKRPAT